MPLAVGGVSPRFPVRKVSGHPPIDAPTRTVVRDRDTRSRDRTRSRPPAGSPRGPVHPLNAAVSAAHQRRDTGPAVTPQPRRRAAQRTAEDLGDSRSIVATLDRAWRAARRSSTHFRRATPARTRTSAPLVHVVAEPVTKLPAHEHLTPERKADAQLYGFNAVACSEWRGGG